MVDDTLDEDLIFDDALVEERLGEEDFKTSGRDVSRSPNVSVIIWPCPLSQEVRLLDQQQ